MSGQLSVGGPGPEEPCGLRVQLRSLREASPALLEARALQDRVDRKFLMARSRLEALVPQLRDDFHLVRADAQLAARYRTVYFDTPQRRFYEDHRRGRRPRFKIRVRHHLDRRLSFLEIKRKGADERTTKARLPRPFGETGLDAEASAFIEQCTPFRPADLVPMVEVTFCRVTLLGESVDERLTLDFEIEVTDRHRVERWTRVAVVEIKQARYASRTSSVRALRALRVRERAFSKYCLATAALVPCRNHVFRPVLRAVEQLSA